MNALFGDLHFLRPWWLWALVALPLLWWLFARQRGNAQTWRSAVDAHLLEHLLVPGQEAAPSAWPRVLLAAGWLLACLALAGPAWERLPQPLYQNRAARVFALELSSSMFAQDVTPSRYERARFKLADLLKRGADAQSALIAYAGDAFVVAPLTDDSNTVLNLVDALDPTVMPAAGNDAARAIDLGVDLIKQSGATHGDIVLLADAAGDNALAAARRARASGMRVSVLAIGTLQGAPVPLPQGGFLKSASGDIVLPKLDAQRLRAVAESGGGDYVPYTHDGADIDALLAAGAFSSAAQMNSSAATSARFQDRGPWLLLALLPLVLLGFRRGWLMLLPLYVLVHSGSVQAFEWRDLWTSPDQQAQAELDAGHAAQAQTLAKSPDLHGAAAYRAGDFASAEHDFDRASDAQAQYNRGNALARQGRYPEAISAYDAALKLSPQMDDAVANKQAIEEWLKQKKQNSQQQKGGKDHQGHEQNQDGQGSSSDEPGKDDQKGNGAGQQDQNQDQQQQNSKSGANDRQQDQQGDSKQDAAEQQSGGKQQGNQNDQASATAKDADDAAQQQFRQNMDEAMKNKADQGDRPAQPVRLGANSDGKPRDEQQQAVEQLIERVPDDPGGLLRRKFQLEYQRRQNRLDGRGGGG